MDQIARKLVESKPRSTDHPKAQRAVGRPKMNTVLDAVAKAAGETADSIRATRGGILRRLSAWLGWHEGLITLRSIAASLRLRSEGHISNLIKTMRPRVCRESDAAGLARASLATLRA